MDVCVILAGGMSSRMKRDKTLLKFSSFASLTHYQYAKFKPYFKEIFISAKEQKFSPPLPLIKDSFSDYSPMGALYSILSNFKERRVFIICADMPFVEIKSVELLFKQSKEYDIYVAADDEFSHSLCGFYSGSVARIAKKLYENGEHQVSKLFKECSFGEYKFQNKEQFFNINYPNDYQVAIQGNL